MENKHRILIICMVFVVMGGMLFDLSNRASKLEQKKQQEQQTSIESIKAKLNQNATEEKTESSESDFRAMEHNARMRAQSPEKNISTVPDVSEKLANVPEYVPQENNTVEPIKTEQKANREFLPEYGISADTSKLPKQYKTYDSYGNRYYFLPATKGDDVLGVVLKLNTSNTISWWKLIKYERIAKPNVRIVSYVPKTLKIYFSQKNGIGSYPINISESGTVLKNPYAPVFFTKLSPETYDFRIIKNFSYNGSSYSIVSFVNKEPVANMDIRLEEFYIYRTKDGNLVKHYFLFDRKIPLNASPPVPDFNITMDETYLTIFAQSKSSVSFTGFNKAVRYDVNILTRNAPPSNSSAPDAVGPGISVVERTN